LLATLTESVDAREVRLTEKETARCVIIVPPQTMAWESDVKEHNHAELEYRRVLLRDSVADLALYLGKMSGAKIETVESMPAKDKRVPIYIGVNAEQIFGPVGISKAGLFGFRVVAGRKGVGLFGESEYGTSYAIYEFLYRLGCRWYLPSEMGECIPQLSTIAIPEMDAALAPATEWRRMENRTADTDFRRRNRMGGSHDGGNVLNANQGGVRAGRWTSQEVADEIADGIIARLDTNYTPTVSLSPGDYVVPTEDPEERKFDPEPRVWEPAANQWSVSDRLIILVNRIAERVGKKYPEVRFGVLVYVNYSMPPVKSKVHPNVIPVIAPIDFNRHHPMTWENHPNEYWLRDMVQGWGKVSSRLGYYAYGMNLAELTAPNPFITKWGTDIPIIMNSNCAYWMPETMGGWESMMPGFYLSTRLTFYPDEKPEDILAEMWTRLYGDAAEPMGRYWHRIDRAWIDAGEYSGCGYGYLRIFTPAVMQGARADIDEALSKCRSVAEYRRVKMIDDSLRLFELFMKMRQDWAAGKLNTLAADLDEWRGSMRHLRRQYRPQYAFDSGLALSYVNWFRGAPYEDASRMAREFTPLGGAMLEWKYSHDKDKQAEERGWTNLDFDDAGWKATHVVNETWSTIGHHNTMGRMAYRTTVKLAAVPAGKKALLWIGSTDGSAKLFVNGQHVQYVVPEKTRRNEKGDVIDAFSGYCRPAQFDVTAAVKPGDNQLTILCERNWLNELGTGGLMGPVVIYREK
jgi:hypothetical protein